MGHISIEDLGNCFLKWHNITLSWQNEDGRGYRAAVDTGLQGVLPSGSEGRTGVTTSFSQGCLVHERDEGEEDGCCSP